MKVIETMHSARDASINLLLDGPHGGQFEARYVERADARVIYVSAQGGCLQACRMCHLTQQGLTNDIDATFGMLRDQIDLVLNAVAERDGPEWLRKETPWHIAFMARGEPLASKYLRKHPETFGALRDHLREMLETRQPIKVKVSTVGPKSFEGELYPFLQTSDVDIYYSYYSSDAAVRKRWLPKTHEPELMLEKLARWQELTHKIPYVHHALIRDVNDRPEDAAHLCIAAYKANLQIFNVNIVRYNPFTTGLGEATTRGRETAYVAALRETTANLSGLYLAQVQVVEPVGPDVYASCGMFTEGTAVK